VIRNAASTLTQHHVLGGSRGVVQRGSQWGPVRFVSRHSPEIYLRALPRYLVKNGNLPIAANSSACNVQIRIMRSPATQIRATELRIPEKRAKDLVPSSASFMVRLRGGPFSRCGKRLPARFTGACFQVGNVRMDPDLSYRSGDELKVRKLASSSLDRIHQHTRGIPRFSPGCIMPKRDNSEIEKVSCLPQAETGIAENA